MTEPILVRLPDEAKSRGLCWCGCGKRTGVGTVTHKARGQLKGVPNRYLAGHGGQQPLRIRLFQQLVIDPAGACYGQARQIAGATAGS